MSAWSDFLELYVLPGTAAILPWPAAWRLLRWFAKNLKPYAALTDAAVRGQSALQPGQLPQDWCWRHRMVRLVDHADLYLSLSRSDAWLDQRLKATGHWPTRGPFLAVTFHWGAGLWSLRHLRRAGLRPAMLSTPVAVRPRWHEPAAQYGRLRNFVVERASGEAVIYLGGAKAKIREHLARGGVLVGLLDVPPSQTPESLPVQLLGRSASFPKGLFDLACECEVPIVPFRLGVDPYTGERELRIEPPLCGPTAQVLADAAAVLFDQALHADAPAWHRWPDAPLFFPAEDPQKR